MIDKDFLKELLDNPLDDAGGSVLLQNWWWAAIYFAEPEFIEIFGSECSEDAIVTQFGSVENFRRAATQLVQWISSKGFDPYPLWDICWAVQYRLDGDAEFTATRIRRLLHRGWLVLMQMEQFQTPLPLVGERWSADEILNAGTPRKGSYAHEIVTLAQKGNSKSQIVERTGYDPKYVGRVLSKRYPHHVSNGDS